MNFEAPELEPSWHIADPTTGFRVERSTQRAVDGRASGSIYSPETPQGSAGILQQRLDAAPLRGQVVRLRAHLSAEGPPGTSARLYLQARRDDGGPGALGVAVTGSSEIRWHRDMVVLEVPVEATQLQFGVLLRGEGRAWIDAVELDALGPPSAVYAPPRALTPRGVENLVTFAHLAGIVRHFHAGAANAQTDWPALLRHYLGEIERTSNEADLRQALERAFLPLEPRLHIFAGEQAQEKPTDEAKADTQRSGSARAWLHTGIATGTAVSARHFRSDLVDPETIDLDSLGVQDDSAPLDGFPEANRAYVFELGGNQGLRVSLPLSVSEAGATRASVPAPRFPDPPVPPSARDRTVRLANVIEAWNWIQHSFPYFDRPYLDHVPDRDPRPEQDWHASLRRALQDAALDGSEGKSEAEFADTLRRLLADLHDAHADVSYLGDFSLQRLPLTWRWLQGRLVITSVGPSAQEILSVGDIVQQIDGRPVADALEQASSLVSAATPGHRLFRALDHLALCTAGSSVSLLLTPGEFQRQVQVPCDTPRYGHGLESSVRPDTIADIKSSLGDRAIVYLDLDRLDDATFHEALPRLQAAHGLIFDLRGYPSRISAAFLQHLIAEPFTLAPTKFPLYTFPDQLAVRWQHKSFTLAPKAPHLDAPCVVLTDGRAISRAETFLAFFADTGRCTILGETSGGTNGEVNSAELAGGFQVFWTGSRVDRRDGSPHFGVGIQPEVAVVPTVAGIRAGRDEVLEAAVALLTSPASEQKEDSYD